MNCNDTSIIPFFKEFPLNSILISLLFNTSSRLLLEEQLKTWNLSSVNPLKSFMKLFFAKFNEDRTFIPKLYGYLKPIEILRSLEPVNYKRDFWFIDYVCKVLKMVEANFILIIYDATKKDYIIAADSVYLSPSSSLTPDFIVFYHSAINTTSSYYIDEYQSLLKKNQKDAQKLNLQTYGIEFKGLDTYDDEITFNGNGYKLTSCLMANKLGTTGFTCDNKKYVYNYWDNSAVCSLVEYNWSLKDESDQGKCFSKETCKISEESCFSFKSGDRLLIYTKKPKESKEAVKLTSSKKTSNIPKEIIKLTSSKNMSNKPKEEPKEKPKEEDEEDVKDYLKDLKLPLSKNPYKHKEIKEEPKEEPKGYDTKDYVIKLLVKQLKEKEKTK